jgi:hypothetical protein
VQVVAVVLDIVLMLQVALVVVGTLLQEVEQMEQRILEAVVVAQTITVQLVVAVVAEL